MATENFYFHVNITVLGKVSLERFFNM